MDWSSIFIIAGLVVILWWAWHNRKVVAVCGHKTRPWTILDSGEESRSFSIPMDAHGQPKCCQACLAKITIRCLSCGHPIFVGDGVTLISPTKEPHSRRELSLFAATAYRPDGERPDPEGRYLGCVRPTCGSGMPRLGTWVIPGRLEWNDSPEWPGCFVGTGE